MRRYNSINGLRTIACLGIVLMHVRANVNYTIGGNIFNTIIKEFTNFVFLFMVISAFSMCCGYFKKIQQNEVSVEKFYKRRIIKILPFFLFLLVINIIYEFNVNTLIEAFANSTLMFGFLQKNIEVLGVAWFLGLVVLFYMMFPFFVFLFSNKKRAWTITIVALLMNFVGKYYFDVDRTNMFYSFIYFCIGGLLYLYKEEIEKLLKNKRVLSVSLIIILTILYFVISNEYLFTLKVLLLCIVLIAYAIAFDSKFLDNKVTAFIGEVSFEIYLCHMLIFRIIEKLHLTKTTGNDYISYSISCILVFLGAIILAKIFKTCYKKIEDRMKCKNEIIDG